MTYVVLVPPIYFNSLQYGDPGDGISDSAPGINAAIATAAAKGGGMVMLPNPVHLIKSPIALNASNVYLAGVGRNSLRVDPSFSGAGKIINITADFCGVRDLQIDFANSTIASNYAGDAIRCSARWARLENLFFFYVNGWCINILAGPGTNCAGVMMNEIYGEHVLQGIHSLSADANFTGQQFLSNCHFERVDGGDGIFLEDVSDFFMSNTMAACTQATGSGSPLHIKGHCQTVKGSSIEFGMFSGNPSSDCVLIESGTNGSPADITLSTGEILDGQNGIHITAGKQIVFEALKIGSNNTSAVVNNGGTAVKVNHCITVNNGLQGSTGRYAFENLAGDMTVNGCEVQEAQGTTAGQLNNVVHLTGGTLYYRPNNVLSGTGWTQTNPFSVSGGTITNGIGTPHALYQGDVTVGSASTLTANTVYFQGVVLSDFATLTTISARFTAGGSGHYDVGVYTDNAGVPGTRIDHAASTNTSLVTVASTTVAPSFLSGNMLLPPGRYWLAFWIDNATDTVLRQAAATAFAGPIRTLSSSGPLPSSGAGAADASTKIQLVGLISGNWS